MELKIIDAQEFGEGCRKLLINNMLVSVFTIGSEAELNIKTITKNKNKNLSIEIKPVTGEISMQYISDKGKHTEIKKIPKNVFSLHINNLPINIFKKNSPVGINMELLFPHSNF